MKAVVLTSEALDQEGLLKALTAFKRADFSVRTPEDDIGVGGKIAGKDTAGWLVLDRLKHDSATPMPGTAQVAHSAVATSS